MGASPVRRSAPRNRWNQQHRIAFVEFRVHGVGEEPVMLPVDQDLIVIHDLMGTGVKDQIAEGLSVSAAELYHEGSQCG